ncbi:hypothetical protein BB561_003198 [Smittium simulii]|uniref:RNA polymerase II transcription factor B subunit 2 n=1 Tax=Smittium simulii TaxID=133385 RepID=A0A2T9YMI5_9FUNG|nr:hypothetical protein BB561_003198 [Smittium simulii]
MYKLTDLTGLEIQVLADLQYLGFIDRKSASDNVIVPTRLVTILTGASISSVRNTLSVLYTKKSTLGDTDNQTYSSNNYATQENEVNELGFILLETNYRLYAYTGNYLNKNLHLFLAKMSSSIYS